MTRARDVADVQENLGGAVPPFAAGKNKIINGSMDWWQRGSSFLGSSSSFVGYTADRWYASLSEVTRQNFTLGELQPAEGYAYYLKTFNKTGTSSGGFDRVEYRVEDVRTLAAQTVTLSFYTRKPTAKNGIIGGSVLQVFGTGGSSSVFAAANFSIAYSGTSWVRHTTTFTMPSLAGKTIGTNSFIGIEFYGNMGGTPNYEFDLWGVQLEAGSAATPFQTVSGSIGGELALCQRYYYRSTGLDGSSAHNFVGVSQSATEVYGNFTIPVTLRAATTTLDFSGVRLVNYGTAAYGITSMAVVESNANVVKLYIVTSSSMTTNRTLFMYAAGTPNFVGISAEL
jgi:hypothetical protein